MSFEKKSEIEKEEFRKFLHREPLKYEEVPLSRFLKRKQVAGREVCRLILKFAEKHPETFNSIPPSVKGALKFFEVITNTEEEKIKQRFRQISPDPEILFWAFFNAKWLKNEKDLSKEEYKERIVSNSSNVQPTAISNVDSTESLLYEKGGEKDEGEK